MLCTLYHACTHAPWCPCAGHVEVAVRYVTHALLPSALDRATTAAALLPLELDASTAATSSADAAALVRGRAQRAFMCIVYL